MQSAESIKKETKNYIMIFVIIAALTLITASLALVHLEMSTRIVIALAIATLQGTLSVCYFMHLISEKKLVYSVLILTAVFFVTLMALTLTGHHDIRTGAQFVP